MEGTVEQSGSGVWSKVAHLLGRSPRRERRRQFALDVARCRGRVLDNTQSLFQWWRTYWRALVLDASPLGPGDLAAGVVAFGYPVLVRVDPTRVYGSVCLAAWVPDELPSGNLFPATVESFEQLGYRVSIDDGGIVAELQNPDASLVPFHRTALLVAQRLGQLAQSLGAVPTTR